MQVNKTNQNAFSRVGIALILGGLMLLLDQFLKTRWLSLAILPFVGAVLAYQGLHDRRMKMALPGIILFLLGLGTLLGFSSIIQMNVLRGIGILLLALGVGWGSVAALTYYFYQNPAWWALVPSGIFWGTGLAFLSAELHWSSFVLDIGLGLGISLLVWGIGRRLFGLVIAGSLICGSSVGIYFGWRPAAVQLTPLASTGTMLVAFALGWLMITVFSRAIARGFVWWPLVPAGILAIVGYGLYFGGNPNNAAGFIGNTGSIGLILMGIYLLMMRREGQN